ncbi:MAG: glutamine--fructose-6-phosphate transaminase (isomerizing) [Pseudomonadota bacterium]
MTCGIIGIAGKENIVALLVDSLKRLEYRGYDSSGLAIIKDHNIHYCRAEGKITSLENKLQQEPDIIGHTGIGHTRWATHGRPTINNAHPHVTGNVAVVHNGIIENYYEIQQELIAQGAIMRSDTDSEVIPQLMTSYLNDGMSIHAAIKKLLSRLKGAFALAILLSDKSDYILAARKGSPLAIGYGKDAMFLGSDAFALAAFTNKITYLEDGDWAEITSDNVKIFDPQGNIIERDIILNAASGAAIGKGNYRHYMLKEIHEQPLVIGETINSFYNPISGEITLPKLNFDLGKIEKINIIACGTSFYAAMVAKYWLEKIAKINVEVDIASEFRYRSPVLSENTLSIFISQSGETADTLAALKYAKQNKQKTLAIVNVTHSSIALEADNILQTLAGPEIGVASTKAFSTQLCVLACFTLYLAKLRNKISLEEQVKYSHALAELPSRIIEILTHKEIYQTIAAYIADMKNILYIGRNINYPIAKEGALKLKEISYIHAEAIAAGELKHGEIALIDENFPIVVIAPHNELFDKISSNIQEVIARGGKIILISDKKAIEKLGDISHHIIKIPQIDEFVSPILYAIPVQLLAYYVGVHKGTDVDQPRNLAKSVTVE